LSGVHTIGPKTGVMSTLKSYTKQIVSYVPEKVTENLKALNKAPKTKVSSWFTETDKPEFEIFENKSVIKGKTVCN